VRKEDRGKPRAVSFYALANDVAAKAVAPSDKIDQKSVYLLDLT
jgi:hypothetical protein